LLALELQKRFIIEKIYPVMIGDMITVVASDESAGERVYTNYFASGCHPNLPEECDSVIVKSVDEQLRLHLDRVCLGTPLLENMTVARIVKMLTKNQGITHSA
jgi:hypothetical protein